MKMRYNLIRILTAVALFVCILISLLTLQDHVLFYQEQHDLFLFTRQYYEQTLHSKGLIGYIGAFMVQFYYYPWLGAAIVSAMLTCIYLMTESIILNITGKRDFLQIGAAVAVALYFTLDGIEESPAWVAITFVGLGILWIAIKLIFGKKWKNKVYRPMTLVQMAVAVVLAATYIIAGFELELYGYNRPERAMIRAERAVKKKNWDEAIDVTGRYLSTGRVNKLMLYLRSYALAQKGELIDHLFDYPQKVGQQALGFPWNEDSREAEYGHLFHEATGDINAAHHWAFEAMTVWGETAPHLIDLGRYNVALGRPAVAKKFANKLKSSLFYRKDAEKIIRQADGLEPVDLQYAVPDSITIGWVNVKDFRPNLMQNYLANPGNNITRQYLIASMLLSNSLKELMPLLTKDDMKSRNIREAILIYTLDPKSEPLDRFGLEVTEETGRDFSHFYSMLKRGIMENLEENYGDTYWYYKHIINPTF